MARQPRLDYPGARHHVFNRAARRERLFLTDSHCGVFIDTLATLPERFGVVLHGYALMPNHYHLMIETPRGNLSKALKHFGAELTTGLNALNHDWDGPVFKGRFRNRVVQEDAYWAYLLLYLHLNPVKSGLVRTVEDSRWTSHGAYAGAEPTPGWLSTAELLEVHGGRDGYLDAIAAAHQGSVQPPALFDPTKFWSVGTRTAQIPADAAPPPLVTPAEALKQVRKVTGLSTAKLKLNRTGYTGNPGRRLLAWWWVHASGLTQADAGKRVGASATQVGHWCVAIRKGSKKNAQIAAWAAELKAL